MVKPQRFCIFCGGSPLSKEHLWSSWTRDVIGVSTALSHSHYQTVAWVAGRDIQPRQRKGTNGGLDTAKLRVVCKTHCNNGWMSRLDTTVKPIATPLIKGATCTLSQSQQAPLARWIIMKTMVIEHATNQPLSTFHERQKIMQGSAPDAQWTIWLTQHTNQSRLRSYVRHLLPERLEGTPGGLNLSNPGLKNTQFFIIRTGRLVVIAIFTRQKLHFTPPGKDTIFCQIFPFNGVVNWPPLEVVPEAMLARMEQDVSVFFGR